MKAQTWFPFEPGSSLSNYWSSYNFLHHLKEPFWPFGNYALNSFSLSFAALCDFHLRRNSVMTRFRGLATDFFRWCVSNWIPCTIFGASLSTSRFLNDFSAEDLPNGYLKIRAAEKNKANFRIVAWKYSIGNKTGKILSISSFCHLFLFLDCCVENQWTYNFYHVRVFKNRDLWVVWIENLSKPETFSAWRWNELSQFWKS